MIVANNPNRIIHSKAASTTQFIDRGGSSTGDMNYKCGPHDFETRNLREFNEHLALLHESGSGSKVASSSVSGVNKLQEILRFQMSNGRL